MPSGAKKRRALRKKKQLEAVILNSTNNNGDNLHGIDENGSQDDKGSDSSLSSPGSQENEAFGRKDQSASLSTGVVKGSAKEVSGDEDGTQGFGPKNGNVMADQRGTDCKKLDSSSHTAKTVYSQDASGLVKGGAKEISGDADVTQGLGSKSGNGITAERGTDYKRNVVEKSPNSSSQNSTHPGKIGASGPVKGSANEISGDADVTQGQRPKSGNAIAVESGASYQKNTVEKSPNSSSQNSTHAAKDVSSQDACGSSVSEIVPAVRGHVKPAVSEKSGLIDTSTPSNLVKQKCDENGANPSPGPEKENTKVVNLPRSAAETSKKVENVKESELPVSSEEKRLLLPGPPVVRTSWLSCCGLFDVVTGSDR